MKVHVIEADMTGTIVDAVKSRDALGRAIAKLADTVNQPVFFHDYKDPVAGAPVVLLECSQGFLDLVKKLPEFKNSHDVWGGLETERKPSIKQYFSQVAASATQTPKQPKKPSHPKP